MASTSQTALVNYAARLVAASRITALTDGTKNANVAQDIYAICLDDLLASHNWNFATRRAKLARSSSTPTFGYDYAYVLPSDWLKTVSVHDNDNGDGTVDAKEEEVAGQGVICASVEDLYLVYVGTVTDVNRMPAKFRMAFVTALARDIAIAIADSNAIRDYFDGRARKALLAAQSVDAQGSAPEKRPAGSWVTSRGGWRTKTDSFRP